MNEVKYITINHLGDYMSATILRVGMNLLLKKDHDNPYDDEAIAVYSEHGNKVGYVANSTQTVCRGTYSAGRVYDTIPEQNECIVRFINQNSDNAIASISTISK